MLRSDLLSLGKRHKKGKKRTPQERDALKAELAAYFKSEAGKRDLEDAPRVAYVDRGDLKHRSMTPEDAVAALLEEIAAMEATKSGA